MYHFWVQFLFLLTCSLLPVVAYAGGWDAWVAEREAAGDSQLLAYADKVMRYRNGFRERGLLDD